MAKVELKQPIVAEIADHLNGAQAAVIVKYHGITVAQDTAMRKELRENGVVYKVYKNTLMKRAFSSALSLKANTTPQKSARSSQRFRPEKFFSADSSAACSPRSQTSPALSSRSRRRTASRRQPKLRQRHKVFIFRKNRFNEPLAKRQHDLSNI